MLGRKVYTMKFQPSKSGLWVLITFLALSNFAFCDELQDAIRTGDLEKWKELLKADPDMVFRKDKSGFTPLHCAVTRGRCHLDVLELLLAYKADVNTTNNSGDAPLHWAAGHGRTDLVEFLLTKKADVNCRDISGRTPLHLARNKETAELLLASNADVNATNNFGDTPLHSAAAGRGRLDVAQFLLANNADVNHKGNFGRTPLHLAVGSGNKEMVELLISGNADVNAADGHNSTPLTEVVGRNQDLAELLLQHGGHGPKCTTKPFVGWYTEGDIRFHLAKSVTDDCQEYITKNNLDLANWFNVYYEGKTGKYAITWEAFPHNQNASWRYALIYDKNNKRVKVMKYDYHRYQC